MKFVLIGSQSFNNYTPQRQLTGMSMSKHEKLLLFFNMIIYSILFLLGLNQILSLILITQHKYAPSEDG